MTTLDWDWAVRTGGNLSRADRRTLWAPLLRSLPRLVAERARAARGVRGAAVGPPSVWPDTALARAAEAEARGVLSAHVLEHSYRTYLFGQALAHIEGVEVDAPDAFVASMLHDLQLEKPTPGRCFAVVGGERAQEFVLASGGDAVRAQRIGAAVAGHLTPGVAFDVSDLAGFVSAGALLDVAGARLGELDSSWLKDVLAQHPRHDFKRHLAAAIRAEASLVPDGRAAWLSRWARFQLLIKAAPFPE